MRHLIPALLLASTAHAASPDAEEPLFNATDTPFALRLHAEVGFLATLDHRLQLGEDGTYVDIKRDLAQDTLYPAFRLSADVDVGKNRRHTLVFLYQPLDLRSEPTLESDITVGEVTWAEDTPMAFRYGFSFWRVSYLYDVLPDPEKEIGLGLSLQIRNANIAYRDLLGADLVAVRNIGPVPVLKFRGRGPVAGRFWMGGEVDGFYAPIRGLNGGSTDVVGAIADASVRAGLAFRRGLDGWLNLRYLGGGAVGPSRRPDPRVPDGFSRNWLHFLTVSVGFSIR